MKFPLQGDVQPSMQAFYQ